MATTSLRIRIPPRSREEEDGDEFVAFGDLCQYIKPSEFCGTCPVEHEDACTLCLAVAIKKTIDNRVLYNKCITWFDRWFRTLLLRKRNATT
jgi:hypothetical protein